MVLHVRQQLLQYILMLQAVICCCRCLSLIVNQRRVILLECTAEMVVHIALVHAAYVLQQLASLCGGLCCRMVTQGFGCQATAAAVHSHVAGRTLRRSAVVLILNLCTHHHSGCFVCDHIYMFVAAILGPAADAAGSDLCHSMFSCCSVLCCTVLRAIAMTVCCWSMFSVNRSPAIPYQRLWVNVGTADCLFQLVHSCLRVCHAVLCCLTVTVPRCAMTISQRSQMMYLGTMYIMI